MSVIFRKYELADLQDLVEMVIGLYTKDGTKTSGMTAEKVRLSAEKLTAESSTGSIFIFEKNGETIGYSIVNGFWSNEFSGQILYIDELFVRPAFRSQNIGSQFFDYLQAKPENDSVAFMLETVPTNENAIRFYKKLGFVTHHNHLLFKLLA